MAIVNQKKVTIKISTEESHATIEGSIGDASVFIQDNLQATTADLYEEATLAKGFQNRRTSLAV